MNNNERFLHSRLSRRSVLKAGFSAAGLFLVRNELSIAQTLPPALAPKPEAPWQDPFDIDQIISLAADGMNIPEDHVRRIL
jgi:hypothetical protein